MDETNNNINYQELFDVIFAAEDHFPISRLYSLSDMPETVTAEFNRRWEQAKSERRAKIARHMADISEENFTVDYAPFAPLFMADPVEEVRLAGLDLLWDSTNTALIEPIIMLMHRDPSLTVRAAAAASLGHYVLMAQWGEVDPAVEGPIVTALLDQIDKKQIDPAMHRAVLESLGASASPRVPALIEQAYHDIDDSINQAAVFAMGRSADPRWIPIINDELESHDADMRAEAARAAAGIGSSEFVDKLVELARFEEDIEVQLAAIFALGQIGSEIASQTLREMVEDEGYIDLHEAIDEALEELAVLGLDFDLSLLDWEEDRFGDDDDDEEDF